MKSGQDSLISKLEIILPRRAWVPVIVTIAVNFIVFSGGGALIDPAKCHQPYLPIDHEIPLVPFFVVFYFLAFAQWGISWIMIGRQSKQFCHYYCKADIIAKAICLVVFLAYPTCLPRPVFESADFFTWLLNLTYWFDSRAVCCLPSIHILASWIAMRASLKMKNVHWAYKAWNVFEMIMCTFAVLYIKQHYVIDIPAGILTAEIGLLAAKKTDNERFLWIR